jgi:hypothetical protein
MVNDVNSRVTPQERKMLFEWLGKKFMLSVEPEFFNKDYATQSRELHIAAIDDFSLGGYLTTAGSSIIKALKHYGTKAIDYLSNEKVMAGTYRGMKAIKDLL